MKKKFTLSELKIKSYEAFLSPEEQKKVQGGYVTIVGGSGQVKVRWTTIETRGDSFIQPDDDFQITPKFPLKR